MQPSDQECVRRCLAGQRNEYRHLVERYEAVVLRYALGLTRGDQGTAEDAAQEAFVRAFSSLDRLEKADSYFSYLVGITRRVVLEQRRDHARTQRTVDAAIEKASVPIAQPPTDEPLWSAIDQLPEVQRHVILLRYFGELSCEEIAERLDRPIGTVTKYLSRAYAKLRHDLRDAHDDEPLAADEVR